MKTVDARGFACPQPVIMAQKAIKADAPGELQVLVDNKCANNLTPFTALPLSWREGRFICQISPFAAKS